MGGLAAAVALRRTRWAVTVHERAPSLDPLGAGLVLWPNAVHALDAIGLGGAVRESALVLGESALRRPDGRFLSRTDGARISARHGAPLLGIRRSDLHALLTDAVGAEALRLGSEVHDPAALAADHDLLVGADGLRSRVRAAGWPGAQAAYAGYTAWRAVVRADVPVTGMSETWGRDERFGIVPMPGGWVYVFATATVGPGLRAGDGAAELAELRRRFGRWHAPIPALLDALEPDAVLRHDVDALPRVPARLHHGTTALLGDAAHAMQPNLGQGACLAIEDAVVLAHTLADGAPVERALEHYSALRRPRAVALSRASAGIGRVTQGVGPVGAAMRDAAVRLTPPRLVLRGSDRAAGWSPPALPSPV
ncbi:FAD-dependent monooxygenase [Actinotalea ferrariae]|nr:FAD-dependent monooxygenase [Actinotalea ferrariae]